MSEWFYRDYQCVSVNCKLVWFVLEYDWMHVALAWYMVKLGLTKIICTEMFRAHEHIIIAEFLHCLKNTN